MVQRGQQHFNGSRKHGVPPGRVVRSPSLPTRSRVYAFSERRAGPSTTPTPACQPARAFPTPVLPSTATRLWDGSVTVDDQYQLVAVPFPVKLYDQTVSTVIISTNGVRSRAGGLRDADILPTVDGIWRRERSVQQLTVACDCSIRRATHRAVFPLSLLYVPAAGCLLWPSPPDFPLSGDDLIIRAGKNHFVAYQVYGGHTLSVRSRSDGLPFSLS